MELLTYDWGVTTSRPDRAMSYLWIAAVWLSIGLFDASQTVLTMRSERMHHAWGKLFFTVTISGFVWAVATPLILSLSKRIPFGKRWLGVGGLVHGLTWATVGLLSAAWISLLELRLNPYVEDQQHSFVTLALDKFSNSILPCILFYIAILVVQRLSEKGFRLTMKEAEAARLNEQLARAQLDALRRQLEPHFLFNALASVSSLIQEGENKTAVSLLADLGDLLRHMLSDSGASQTTLEDEWTSAQRYLNIQKIRFGDRLALNIEIPKELHSALVPSFLLQPLIENAIKHGLARRRAGGVLRITAVEKGGQLVLAIANSVAADASPTAEPGAGIALRNLRTRLESMYGQNSSVVMSAF